MTSPVPGNDNSGNRRNSRLVPATDNDTSKRLVDPLTGTGIAFVAPDTITDTGNGLGRFEPGALLRVEGSAGNSGDYTIDTVAAGSIALIEQTIGAEIAGPSVTLSCVNNRNRNRFS